MLKTAIPVMYISDAKRAEEFYCRRLGFTLLAAWRAQETNPDPCYMTVARDGATFGTPIETSSPLGSGSAEERRAEPAAVACWTPEGPI
jgi:catechol 2,3-dioxygenase-like lactoylglutathione lyase family enzyme